MRLLEITSAHTLRKITTTIFSVTATIALLGSALPALAISGGAASAKPWVVQLMGRENGKRITCSGAALGPDLVITAAHCPWAEIIYPDGSRAAPQAYYSVEGGADIRLITLAQTHPLKEYPTIGPNYLADKRILPAGTVGTAYGHANGVQKSLSIKLKNHGHTKETREVLQVVGRNGGVERGDSGGPLIINGLLVGILSETNPEHTLGEYHGLSTTISLLRQMQHAREMRSVDIGESAVPWISKVRVSNQRLYVDMSSELINSGKKVAMWVNGKYVGSVWNDISYYCDKFNYAGGSEISPLTPIQGGDLIQIGIDEGAGPNSPTGSQMLFETQNNGVEVVKRLEDVITFRLSSELVNSGKRIIIWYDGVYAAEVYKGTVFYSTVVDVPGGKNFFPNWSSVPLDTVVAVGVVDGRPGAAFGTPATAKEILYNDIPEVEE